MLRGREREERVAGNAKVYNHLIRRARWSSSLVEGVAGGWREGGREGEREERRVEAWE